MHCKTYGEELNLGRDRFVRLMRDHGLRLRNRTYKPRTTDSRHGLPKYPNLITEFIPKKPCQLWVSDITYIPCKLRERRFYYLSLLTDAYSHEIVGWALSPTLELKGPIEALEMAMRKKKVDLSGLIHHSDRGCQYCSAKYVSKLRSKGIRISMTESGDPKENAVAERINGIIKNELLGGEALGTFESAIKTLEEKISFYNKERPHMSIGMLTPVAASIMEGELGKRWDSRRESHIKAKQRVT